MAGNLNLNHYWPTRTEQTYKLKPTTTKHELQVLLYGKHPQPTLTQLDEVNRMVASSLARERFTTLYGIKPNDPRADPKAFNHIENQIIREHSHKSKWQQEVSSQLQWEHIGAKWEKLDEAGKLTKEYAEESFDLYLEWKKGGKHLLNFSSELLTMLAKTDTANVPIESLLTTYHSNFYLSLRDLDVSLFDSVISKVDGVFTIRTSFREELDTPQMESNSASSEGIKLIFVGDFLPLTLKYGSLFETTSDVPFFSFDLKLTPQLGRLTVDDSLKELLTDFIGYIALTLLLPHDLQDELTIAYQRMTKELIPCVINAILYTSQHIEKPVHRLPIDLPGQLEKKLRTAKTKHQRQNALAEIGQAGFKSIEFFGEQYIGSLTKSAAMDIAITPHWRRGHWRNQPVGIGLQDRRLLWIKPTIVGKDAGLPIGGQLHTAKPLLSQNKDAQ
ncbi:hypothetical protein [Spirosoma endbachense]|uniref:Uncharacterized protein n=1 Tax=Spirosoma endbachense TaxID=2666025 RepID=A0A6P1W426_9BACT|nr:hypothetical protein [Spirosoma endbachense]QHV99308.1 hypothetical protein GJR95_31750 [Spirosoma endbachense]